MHHRDQTAITAHSFIFLLSNSSSLCGSQAKLESSPHSTLRSLSPNKEQPKLFPLAFLSSPLFVWTALANSPSACSFGGNAGRFLTLFAAPLCALWLVSGWNHSAAIDPGSYSTWIWWWLFHDLNINSIFPLPMSHGFFGGDLFPRIRSVMEKISWRSKV